MILLVTGTRPEILKTAPVLWELHKRSVPFLWAHTGQHSDKNMSQIFFDEVVGFSPNFILQRQSSDLSKMISEIRSGLMGHINLSRAKVILVQGDTASALAGALYGHEQRIPVAHIEAGLRSYDLCALEEVIRVTIDQMSKLLFAPTPRALETLQDEIDRRCSTQRVYYFGHTIADVVYKFMPLISTRVLDDVEVSQKGYFLLTVHRRENLSSKRRMHMIFGVARELIAHKVPIVFPVHPHTAQKLKDSGLDGYLDMMTSIEPQSFSDFLALEQHALAVITDSGGVQEETLILGTPCIVVRRSTERPETIDAGASVLFDPLESDIDELFEYLSNLSPETQRWDCSCYGLGNAGEKIVDVLEKACGI